VFKLHRILLAGALLAMVSTTSQAASLPAGDLGGTADVVTVDPPGLLKGATTITPHFNLAGTGGSLAGFTADNTVSVDLAHLDTFTMTFTNGSSVLTFTANGFNTYGTVPMTGPPTFLNIGFTGIVDLDGVTGNGVLALTFAQVTGSSPITGSLSLAVMSVPEPSSIALAGIGMAAAGLFGLRKRYAK